LTDQLRTWQLSPQARALYLAILYGAEADPADDALRELTTFGLVVAHPASTAGYIALPPAEAANRRRDDLLSQIAEAMTGAAHLPEHVQDLAIAYQAHRELTAPAAESGVEHLQGVEEINARISELVGQTTQEILSAQPGGPRPEATLRLALPRDLDALARGVTMRTLYEDVVRTDPATAAWASAATAAGAHVRTTGETFGRAIILDRRWAVLADETPWVGPGDEPARALIVHDAGLVAYVATVVDREWSRASVWKGRVGKAPSAPAVPAVLTDRQREIARQLVAGASQAAAGAAVGLSERAVQGEIAAIRRTLGVETMTALGWALAQL
jgi:sugar-specific transcriptional regulator TrmB/DNA-binding CsgD family transcriptional regulator